MSGAADAVSLKAGDRIMVGVARADDGSLDHSQILIVDKTWTSFGLRYVKTKGAITCLDSLYSLLRAGPVSNNLFRWQKRQAGRRRSSFIGIEP